jgi:tetratricopeptide (TPR) repeat protein
MDPTAPNKTDPSKYASITSPIPLLALYGGITEAILALITFKATEANQRLLLGGTLLLPVLWLTAIVFLIARYHDKLYSPRDYGDPEQFLRALTVRESAIRQGTLGAPGEYVPFILPRLEGREAKDIEGRVGQWTRLLEGIDPVQCLTLHAWYNEREQHSVAFATLNLAISKGLTASKNFSFASSSLRKLGRLREAENFATFALDLDPDNVDAKYNLSRIYLDMDRLAKAESLAQDVLRSGKDEYRVRIMKFFPNAANSLAATGKQAGA